TLSPLKASWRRTDPIPSMPETGCCLTARKSSRGTPRTEVPARKIRKRQSSIESPPDAPRIQNFEVRRRYSKYEQVYGLVVASLDAAPSFFPSTVTVRAFAILEPSLAWLPSTLTSIPIFSVERVQPCRARPFGLPISQPQFVTLPVFGSFTST